MQKLAYKTAIQAYASASALQCSSLAYSQIPRLIQLNSTIKNLLQSVKTENKSILDDAVFNVQQAISFILNSSSQVETAASLAEMQVYRQQRLFTDMNRTAALLAQTQVSQQQQLFTDMNRAANNSCVSPGVRFQLAKSLSSRTIQAIETARIQQLAEVAALASQNSALIILLQLESTLQIFKDQNLADLTSKQMVKSAIKEINTMVSIAQKIAQSINDSILQANLAKEAATQANIAQSIALQAAAVVARLALCYPNPCMYGGMCTVNSDNSSFTCFCSVNYRGLIIVKIRI